jgi:hypothetical protein
MHFLLKQLFYKLFKINLFKVCPNFAIKYENSKACIKIFDKYLEYTYAYV